MGIRQRLEEKAAVETQRKAGGALAEEQEIPSETHDMVPIGSLSKVQKFLQLPGIKQGVQAASMGAGFLAERASEFRGVTSLLLPGGVPLTKENLRRAAQFDVEVTGLEFARHILPDELIEEAETSAFPGWTKKVVDPFSPEHGKEVPRFTVGDAIGLGTEIIVDPFFLVGAMPRKALTPIVQGATKTLQVATYPLRPIMRGMQAGITQNGLANRIGVHVLSPQASWKWNPEPAQLLTLHNNQLAARAHVVHDQLGTLVKRHNLGRVMRRPKNSNIDQEKVWRHLQISPQELNTAERALVDDFKNILKEYERRFIENGDEFFKYKNISGRTIKRKYDAENLLRDMRPLLHGVERVPSRSLGPTPLNVRNSIHMPFRNLARPGDEMFPWQKVSALNRDPLHAMQAFMTTAEKRLVYHARVRKGKRFVPVGLLEKYKLTSDDWRGPNQNPLLKDANAVEFQNFRSKVHHITGHSKGREGIAAAAKTEKFLYELGRMMNPRSARYNRVVDLVTRPIRGIGGVPRMFEDGTPMLTKLDDFSTFLAKNQMIAFLGFNPGSAIKNTSQLLSLAAVKGMYPTLKGIYRMVATDELSTRLRTLRKGAGLNDSVQRLINDESFTFLNRFENSAMYMFNAFENFMRGTAFNVYTGQKLQQMTKAGVKLADLSDAQLQNALNVGILGANKVNFTYGMAGRSEFMARPLTRLATNLQSYNWKFAGFANDLLQQDPTAFTRLVALHGWAIEQAYLQSGINAESWLGWGFIGPNPVGRGPAFEILWNLTKAQILAAQGNEAEASKLIDRTTASVRALSEMAEAGKIPGWVPQAAYVSSAIGLSPFPITATSKFARAVQLFQTGEVRASDGQLIRHIDHDQVMQSTMFQLHQDVVGRALDTLSRQNRNRYNFEVNRRVKRIVKAFNSQDGDMALQAAAEGMWDPIMIKTDLPANSVVGSALSNLVATPDWVRPRPSDITQRLRTEIVESVTPRAIREMISSGWLESVLMGVYSQRALEAIEQMPEAQGQE